MQPYSLDEQTIRISLRTPDFLSATGWSGERNQS